MFLGGRPSRTGRLDAALSPYEGLGGGGTAVVATSTAMYSKLYGIAQVWLIPAVFFFFLHDEF